MSPLPASSARYTQMPVFSFSEAKLPSSDLALHVSKKLALTIMIGIALPIAWLHELRRKPQN
jgi:hypothetical protein